jgi:hypothetical protein
MKKLFKIVTIVAFVIPISLIAFSQSVKTPVPLEINGKIIDFQTPKVAPVCYDLNKDGLNDLIVGTYYGEFEYFENIGTNEKPLYKELTFLKTNGNTITIPMLFTRALNPQFIDLNKDGNIDILFSTLGKVHVLYGNGNNSFNKPIALRDTSGGLVNMGLYHDANTGGNKTDEHRLYHKDWRKVIDWLRVASAVDWDNDGDLDLLLGGAKGLRGCINEGSKTKMELNTKSFNIIRFKEQQAENDKSFYLITVITDWDGDGLWDLMGGNTTGGVYLFKNTGTIEKPSFSNVPTCLVKPDEIKNTKGYTQIAVTDYNNDGKKDILIGVMIKEPNSTFTQEELQKRKELETLLDETDKKIDVRFNYINKNYTGKERTSRLKNDPTLVSCTQQCDEISRKINIYKENYGIGAGTSGKIFIAFGK